MIRRRDVDGDRQPRHRTRLSHGDAAALGKVLVAGGDEWQCSLEQRGAV